MSADDTLWLQHLGAEIGIRGGRYRGRCAVLGDGEPLILLHGQGGHLENFSRNLRALSAIGRVHVPDALWHGLGPRTEFDDRLVPAFVDQVVDLMDSEGIESAHLIGQSMGGWTVMQFAIQHPERVRSLILATAQGYGGSLGADGVPEIAPAPGGALRAQQFEVLRDPTPERIRSRLVGLFHDPSGLPAEMVDLRQRLYSMPEVNASLQQVLGAYMSGPGSPSWEHTVTDDLLADVRRPALVYWAESNPVPPPVGQRLANALRAEYHCADRTGHWAQFENADEFNRVALDFLRRVTNP